MQSPTPSEYFQDIRFNYSFYTSKEGGIQTTTITTSGTITTNLFSGSGASLTSLNPSNISGGTLAVNIGGTGKNTLTTTQLLSGNTTNPIIQSSNLTWDNSLNILTVSNIAGNGSRLTNLNASNISDGTLAVTRGGTGATNFTVGRLLIGNGTTAITEDGNLTWSTPPSKLDIVGTTTITNTTGLNLDIVKTSTTASDLINMRYDSTNGLRFNQTYVSANDIKYNLIQKSNNIDNNIFTCYKGCLSVKVPNPSNLYDLEVQNTTRSYTMSCQNIGIGMTQPTRPVEIVFSGTTNIDVINISRTGSSCGFRLQEGYVNTTDLNHIFIQNNIGTDTSIMTFYKGNLGIGTTTPDITSKLDVVGTTTMTNASGLNLDIVKFANGDLLNMRYDTTI